METHNHSGTLRGQVGTSSSSGGAAFSSSQVSLDGEATSSRSGSAYKYATPIVYLAESGAINSLVTDDLIVMSRSVFEELLAEWNDKSEEP